MVFIDGVGLGSPDPRWNPIFRGHCPTLAAWLRRRAVAVDATLGVPGLPQSATGQAALFTGVNAAAAMGRHVEGIPGSRLRRLIAAENLLLKLVRRGYRVTFANAFYVEDTGEVWHRPRLSVTTVAALSALGRVRTRGDLLVGTAVYHDLTRESLLSRGYRGPLLCPEEAAEHLIAIAADHDFTLFEFFETDLAAHRGEEAHLVGILRKLDRFLGALRRWLHRARALLVITSDHGNLEDSRVRTHTANPVPLIALGYRAAECRDGVMSLVDVTPTLLSMYPVRR